MHHRLPRGIAGERSRTTRCATRAFGGRACQQHGTRGRESKPRSSSAEYNRVVPGEPGSQGAPSYDAAGDAGAHASIGTLSIQNPFRYQLPVPGSYAMVTCVVDIPDRVRAGYLANLATGESHVARVVVDQRHVQLARVPCTHQDEMEGVHTGDAAVARDRHQVRRAAHEPDRRPAVGVVGRGRTRWWAGWQGPGRPRGLGRCRRHHGCGQYGDTEGPKDRPGSLVTMHDQQSRPHCLTAGRD